MKGCKRFVLQACKSVGLFHLYAGSGWRRKRLAILCYHGVSLEDALEITALESKTFWRPVTTNTIFVAQDNPAKRKELARVRQSLASNGAAPKG